MFLLERGQPGQKPFGGERGQGRDRQHTVVVLAQQLVGGEPEIVERGPDAREVILGLRRQGQRAVLPDKQGDSELLLQPLDLMADRGLRHVQLGRRLGEAQMPGGGLKARNPFSEGSLAVISASQYMSLYHAKRYKVSFVKTPVSADISLNKLAKGVLNVHFHT